MKKSIICHDCKFAKEDDGQFKCLLLDLDVPEKECDHYLPPAGRYDDIETARELISEVARHGLSTQQHDRNRAADIIGREPIGNLAKLANSEEEICGKRVGPMFYFIAFSVWNWEDAARFYNEHTLLLTKEYRVLLEERDALKSKLVAYKSSSETFKTAYEEQNTKRVEAETALGAAQNEIVALKAKLYDLMTAGA